jgi:LCP family protein required for cell wall assembly
MWPRNGTRVTGEVPGGPAGGGRRNLSQTMSYQAPERPAGSGRPRGRAQRVLKWTALVLSLVLIGSGAAVYGYYRKLQGNIKKEDMGDLLGENRPKKLSQAMNILLIGSDSRAGENAVYGTTEGARADTTMLLHLSPGGDRAIGMSFPRDLMVNIPACRRKPGGPATPAQFGMINSAFSIAGASCTWKTIESLTQIHIDHYVEIDFSGFKRVVDALGGVEICLPHAVNDPKAKLNLPAGRQTVRGDAALGYVRTRTGGLGNGSDLSRIDRQKRFMSAVVQKATSSAMLTDPAAFVRVLDAATKSITTDKDFSVGDMRRLAGSLKGMGAGGVRFVTVPFAAYAPDPNRVSLDRLRAEPLFEAIRQDSGETGEPESGEGAGLQRRRHLRTGHAGHEPAQGGRLPGHRGGCSAAERHRREDPDPVRPRRRTAGRRARRRRRGRDTDPAHLCPRRGGLPRHRQGLEGIQGPDAHGHGRGPRRPEHLQGRLTASPRKAGLTGERSCTRRVAVSGTAAAARARTAPRRRRTRHSVRVPERSVSRGRVSFRAATPAPVAERG